MTLTLDGRPDGRVRPCKGDPNDETKKKFCRGCTALHDTTIQTKMVEALYPLINDIPAFNKKAQALQNVLQHAPYTITHTVAHFEPRTARTCKNTLVLDLRHSVDG